jgi:dCMP deaminase
MSKKWDKRFLELAKHIASWSKDPSTKVGAILVNDQKIVVGMGYNGFARGVHDEKGRYLDRERKYKFVVHAEVNAILQAGNNAKGSTLYVFPSFMLPPICHECCKFAIQAGVKRIVGYTPDINEERVSRWRDSIAVSRTMCGEAGIAYEGINQ